MKTRIIKVKNSKIQKELKEKKWHKLFKKEIIREMKLICPILDFNHKNLLISIEIDQYQHFTTVMFFLNTYDNPILKVSDIYHEKEKIIQMGQNYGLITY